MIEFGSLQCALNYRNSCPLCDAELTIDDVRNYSSYFDYNIRPGTFVLDKPDLKATIDLRDDQILEFKYYPATNAMGAMIGNHPINGVLYEKIVKGCDNCSQYTYCIQILFDFNKKNIKSTNLNSETITFWSQEEPGTIHEIRNNYNFNQTEYHYYNGQKISKLNQMYPPNETGMKIPLIDLDVSNPFKTLQRIKTLITFS